MSMNSGIGIHKKVPEAATSGLFVTNFLNVRLCCRLLLLSTVKPMQNAVIENICHYTCCNGNKKCMSNTSSIVITSFRLNAGKELAARQL